MPEEHGLLEAVERPIAEVHVHAWITCRKGWEPVVLFSSEARGYLAFFLFVVSYP